MIGAAQRLQHHCVDYRKNGDRRADAERQSTNRCCGKSGILAQQPQSETHILDNSFEEG
jgi:hypothetical protein